MIEKLSFLDASVNCVDYNGFVHNVADSSIINKINELVNAVNELQTRLNNHELLHIRNEIDTLDDPTYHETPADPYAEQRKWIGKLCHFWNKTEYTDDIYGFLTDIVSTNKYKPEDNYFVPFKDEFGSFYEHCEPVKPDDDIIYKGDK